MTPKETFAHIARAQKLFEATHDPFYLSMTERLAELLTRPASDVHLAVIRSLDTCWNAYLTLFGEGGKNGE